MTTFDKFLEILKNTSFEFESHIQLIKQIIIVVKYFCFNETQSKIAKDVLSLLCLKLRQKVEVIVRENNCKADLKKSNNIKSMFIKLLKEEYESTFKDYWDFINSVIHKSHIFDKDQSFKKVLGAYQFIDDSNIYSKII